MLGTLGPKFECLSLKNSVEKSCDIVFKHKINRASTTSMSQGQPFKLVSDRVYLGVVSMDNLARSCDEVRAKRIFSSNITQHTKSLVMLLPNSCYLLSEKT